MVRLVTPQAQQTDIGTNIITNGQVQTRQLERQTYRQNDSQIVRDINKQTDLGGLRITQRVSDYIYVGRGVALVESKPFYRRAMGSNPALPVT